MSNVVQLPIPGSGTIENRGEKVRALFKEHGGLDLHRFAQASVDAGLYTEDELEAFKLKGVAESNRRYLRELDAHGLPFAGKTCEEAEDGRPVWQQREYWTFEDYAMNVSTHIKLRDENHEMALRLARECGLRFGRVPFVDSLELEAA